MLQCVQFIIITVSDRLRYSDAKVSQGSDTSDLCGIFNNHFTYESVGERDEQISQHSMAAFLTEKVCACCRHA